MSLIRATRILFITVGWLLVIAALVISSQDPTPDAGAIYAFGAVVTFVLDYFVLRPIFINHEALTKDENGKQL